MFTKITIIITIYCPPLFRLYIGDKSLDRIEAINLHNATIAL